MQQDMKLTLYYYSTPNNFYGVTDEGNSTENIENKIILSRRLCHYL